MMNACNSKVALAFAAQSPSQTVVGGIEQSFAGGRKQFSAAVRQIEKCSYPVRARKVNAPYQAIAG